MNMHDCQKFEKCSAPICLLDTDRQERSHLKSEPVCFYLREYVKNGGRGRLLVHTPRELVELIADRLPEITSRHVDIKHRLDRAAKSGAKMETFKLPTNYQEARYLYNRVIRHGGNYRHE